MKMMTRAGTMWLFLVAPNHGPEISAGELEWLVQPGEIVGLLKASPKP